MRRDCRNGASAGERQPDGTGRGISKGSVSPTEDVKGYTSNIIERESTEERMSIE